MRSKLITWLFMSCEDNAAQTLLYVSLCGRLKNANIIASVEQSLIYNTCTTRLPVKNT